MTADRPGTARVSVIVPVWNEAAHLPRCLASVAAAQASVELLVVDGGSDDDSAAIARAAGAVVLDSTIRQRSAQLNLGAAHASGDWLLFLHADTQLPPEWRNALDELISLQPDLVGGCFRRRFDDDSRFLRFTCRLADWRARQFGWFLGDQGMFVRAATFRELGGFADLPACEDLDFSIRLARRGRTAVVDATVVSSARRFVRRGPIGQTVRDLVTVVRFVSSRRGRSG